MKKKNSNDYRLRQIEAEMESKREVGFLNETKWDQTGKDLYDNAFPRLIKVEDFILTFQSVLIYIAMVAGISTVLLACYGLFKLIGK